MISKLSIRQWVIIILLLLTLVPFLGTKFISNMYNRYSSDSYENNQVRENNVQEWIEKSILLKPELWGNSKWKNNTIKDLHNKGIEIILVDSNDQIVFTSTNEASGKIVHQKGNYSIGLSKSAFEKQTIYKEGKATGIAFIKYAPPAVGAEVNKPKNAFLQQWGGVIVWIFLFFLVLLLCIIITHKMIIRPLKLLERAALSLSRNEFTSVLPASSVQEINAVSDGFKFMQQELHELLASKTQMEEDRKIFVASIVHDLRTPLFSIRGYLEGLEKGIANSPEKQKKYIKVCKNKADLLEELVSNLFEYVKLEFKSLVQNIVEGYDLACREKNISLALERPKEPLTLQGNAPLLTRSIDNIVSNAIRYTPKDGSINIILENTAKEIIITIKDSGEGIPEEILLHIFKPLYRGEYSRNRQTGGTGLGLTIAKHGFRMHGGDLTVKNNYPKGAIFIGHIPIN
jgi:signal transduction histidine kinase